MSETDISAILGKLSELNQKMETIDGKTDSLHDAVLILQHNQSLFSKAVTAFWTLVVAIAGGIAATFHWGKH